MRVTGGSRQEGVGPGAQGAAGFPEKAGPVPSGRGDGETHGQPEEDERTPTASLSFLAGVRDVGFREAGGPRGRSRERRREVTVAERREQADGQEVVSLLGSTGRPPLGRP